MRVSSIVEVPCQAAALKEARYPKLPTHIGLSPHTCEVAKEIQR
jgi:hypothetical protein